MADDQRKVRISLLKNELMLVKHEAERLGLEIVATLVRMAILEVDGRLNPGSEQACH